MKKKIILLITVIVVIVSIAYGYGNINHRYQPSKVIKAEHLDKNGCTANERSV